MSNKYLYLNGELRGPFEMEEPSDLYNTEQYHGAAEDEYKAYIRSIPTIKVVGNNRFIENKFYYSEKNFELQLGINENWIPGDSIDDTLPIIAIQVNQPHMTQEQSK